MISTHNNRCKNPAGNYCTGSVIRSFRLLWLGLFLLLGGIPALAQSPEAAPVRRVQSNLPDSPQPSASEGQQLPDQQLPGTIRGTILDSTGTAVVGAKVRLTRVDQALIEESLSDENGQFFFANVSPGPFLLTITSEGFASQSLSGTLHSGESYVVPQMSMALATAVTEVHVELSQIEVAQEQMKDEEKQRVLGVIPNFYVTYIPDAAPLSSKQKFNLAWKLSIDPVSIGLTGAVAGIEQASDRFSGYGQGAQGYAKRFGAGYADLVIGTFIGSAILPSVFKQDPRYFYKGTGGTKARVLYAIANSVICKGDNGHWQANYSGIIGGLASGAISNLYYPAEDRNGAALTFENTLIGIGATAAANILQEFVIKRFTSNVPSLPGASVADPANP